MIFDIYFWIMAAFSLAILLVGAVCYGLVQRASARAWEQAYIEKNLQLHAAVTSQALRRVEQHESSRHFRLGDIGRLQDEN